MYLPNPPTSAPVGFDDALYYPIWVNTGYGDVRSLVRVFGCWICSLFVSSVFMSVSSGGDSTPSVTNSITCFSNPPLLFFQNSHITLCTSLFAVPRPPSSTSQSYCDNDPAGMKSYFQKGSTLFDSLEECCEKWFAYQVGNICMSR